MAGNSQVIPAIALPLTFAFTGCSQEGSRDETTTLSDSATEVAECVERFADRGVWGDGNVRASFVYDVTELGLDGIEAMWDAQPEEGGKHSMTIHTGGGGNRALERFLKSDPKGDTEAFGMDGVALIRVNYDAADSFEEALRTGCERLRDGVSIKQVTFSRG